MASALQKYGFVIDMLPSCARFLISFVSDANSILWIILKKRISRNYYP